MRVTRIRRNPAAILALAWGFVLPAAAHVAGPMDASFPAPTWNFDPWVVAPLILTAVLYAAGYRALGSRARAGRSALRRQALAFAGGWLALVVALVSPLDPLGGLLFSAHMVQHELMMIVAAPLLVLGRPLVTMLWAFPAGARGSIGRGVHVAWVRKAWHVLTLATVAWLFHAVALWLWHVPALFERALAHPGLHALQHASFLASALVFWWTIFSPRAAVAGAGAAMLSLFTTMVHTGALGALLTLAPDLWYPSYADPASAWGFDPLVDQQLGGLIMWVPGGVAYLIGGLVVAAQRLLLRDHPRTSWGTGSGS